MSKDTKLFSCESLRMTNAALLLAASLCLPSAAEAALGGVKMGLQPQPHRLFSKAAQ